MLALIWCTMKYRYLSWFLLLASICSVNVTAWLAPAVPLRVTLHGMFHPNQVRSRRRSTQHAYRHRCSTQHAYRWFDAAALQCISDGIVIPPSSSSADQLTYSDLDLVEYRCTISCNLTREDLSATSAIGDTYLGVITSSKKAVHPLGLRTHSLDDKDTAADKDVELFCDDSFSSIAIVSDPMGLQSGAVIVGVVDASLCCLSQRIVEDRVSNPHGEHAEDVWVLSKAVLMSLWEKSNNPSYISTIN